MKSLGRSIRQIAIRERGDLREKALQEIAEKEIAQMGASGTCETGWKQVTDDCPVCGPDGPCEIEPDRVKPSKGSIKAVLDAVTDRVLAYRPKDKGEWAKRVVPSGD